MSTAFLVDNILNEDKDEQMDSTGSISESDESDSDHNSDLKDSLCDSPKSYNSMNHQNSPLSEDELIRSYTVIQDQAENVENFSEFHCVKCGHFNENIKINNDSIDDKCEKCGFLNDFYHQNSKDTHIKELPSKPVLKFSVSAILSDTKRDCVKVRNGNYTPTSSQSSNIFCDYQGSCFLTKNFLVLVKWSNNTLTRFLRKKPMC